MRWTNCLLPFKLLEVKGSKNGNCLQVKLGNIKQLQRSKVRSILHWGWLFSDASLRTRNNYLHNKWKIMHGICDWLQSVAVCNSFNCWITIYQKGRSKRVIKEILFQFQIQLIPVFPFKKIKDQGDSK